MLSIKMCDLTLSRAAKGVPFRFLAACARTRKGKLRGIGFLMDRLKKEHQIPIEVINNQLPSLQIRQEEVITRLILGDRLCTRIAPEWRERREDQLLDEYLFVWPE
jgi:hypothetical protein